MKDNQILNLLMLVYVSIIGLIYFQFKHLMPSYIPISLILIIIYFLSLSKTTKEIGGIAYLLMGVTIPITLPYFIVKDLSKIISFPSSIFLVSLIYSIFLYNHYRNNKSILTDDNLSFKVNIEKSLFILDKNLNRKQHYNSIWETTNVGSDAVCCKMYWSQDHEFNLCSYKLVTDQSNLSEKILKNKENLITIFKDKNADSSFEGLVSHTTSVTDYYSKKKEIDPSFDNYIFFTESEDSIRYSIYDNDFKLMNIISKIKVPSDMYENERPLMSNFFHHTKRKLLLESPYGMFLNFYMNPDTIHSYYKNKINKK